MLWLARNVLDDPHASVRELVLAHWLLSARRESSEG
jgi:hypothetical protein